MRLLLNNRADINAKSNDRKMALHLAIRLKNEAVVQLLVNSAADTEATDSNSKTVLQWAA